MRIFDIFRTRETVIRFTCAGLILPFAFVTGLIAPKIIARINVYQHHSFEFVGLQTPSGQRP
jgi:hypothetical protein